MVVCKFWYVLGTNSEKTVQWNTVYVTNILDIDTVPQGFHDLEYTIHIIYGQFGLQQIVFLICSVFIEEMDLNISLLSIGLCDEDALGLETPNRLCFALGPDPLH